MNYSKKIILLFLCFVYGFFSHAKVNIEYERNLNDVNFSKTKGDFDLNKSTMGSDLGRSHVAVNIEKGVTAPMKIAININGGMVSGTHHELHSKIEEVIINNLENTGLFSSISSKAFLQHLSSISQTPKFDLWKTINTQYLANIEIIVVGNIIKIKCKLYDILTRQDMGGISLEGDMNLWRKFAHKLSNNIYEKITGDTGYFDTRVLYVAIDKKKKHYLAVMDQDGYNHKLLTKGNHLILTPRFAPNGKECTFFAYIEKILNGRRIPVKASVYRYSFANAGTKEVIDFKGMTYAPRYSPDGRTMIFSLAKKGFSSIYTYNLDSNRLQKITQGPYIDTSPCYSPDGRFIVFNSDRSGTQQIYVMDSDGTNIRRLSTAKGRYATPVWSPRGDYIVFTKIISGAFFIGIIKPDGEDERMIASGNIVEGPTWAPNGRVVMFSNKDWNGTERLYRVDITGRHKNLVKTPMNAIDSDWSHSQ